MIKFFKDRIKVHTSSSGTQYVDREEARALHLLDIGFDLDALILARIKKYREEQAHISQLEEEPRRERGNV